MQIQLRRGLAQQWITNNPVLAQGEPAYETDTGRFKIGDGTSTYNQLPYTNQDVGLIIALGW